MLPKDLHLGGIRRDITVLKLVETLITASERNNPDILEQAALGVLSACCFYYSYLYLEIPSTKFRW